MNDYSRFPQGLKDSALFCLWKREPYTDKKDGETKYKKVPYNPHTGKKGDPTDRKTFGTFEEARKEFNRRPKFYNGLGIGIFGNLAGIDIDHCIDADGNLSDIAEDIIQKLGSYTEKSPSCAGVHILCYATGVQYDRVKYYIKNPHNNVEFYIAGSTDRFLTITGDAMPNSETINERATEIGNLAEKYMNRSLFTKSVQSNQQDPPADEEDELFRWTYSLDDDSVLRRMFIGKNGDSIQRFWNGDIAGYSSQSEADLALCNHLAFYTRKDPEQMDRLFRASGLYRDKWDELRGAETYGAMTIRKAIDNTRNVWSPNFRPIEMNNNVESALSFLKQENMIDNPRYNRMDDIAAGYLLADYIKPFARPMCDDKKWVVYDGIRWDDSGGTPVVEEAAKSISRALLVYAGSCESDRLKDAVSKWANTWSQRSKRKQFIQDAMTVYPVSRSDFDKNPWLLNLNNGTLDLRILELREHDPEDLITQIAPVDYRPELGVPKLWDDFISQIMCPGESECPEDDLDLQVEIGIQKAKFLQRYLGYSLSGDTREESFLIMYGPTSRNGKSVCVESVKAVMGSYARSVNVDTLLSTKSNRNSSAPSEDVARLAGIRMASVGEIPQGSMLDGARVKLLTGGDSVNARFLGENSFDFIPQFKLILHTNHLPTCTDDTVFASGRVLVLPFSRHFKDDEQDKSLKHKFKEPEMQSGILNWLLAGMKMYQHDGLKAPGIVKDATGEYRRDNDRVSRFIGERLTEDIGYREPAADIYTSYYQWCRANGQYAERNIAFQGKLKSMGIKIGQGRPSNGGNPTTVIWNRRLVEDYDNSIGATG